MGVMSWRGGSIQVLLGLGTEEEMIRVSSLFIRKLKKPMPRRAAMYCLHPDDRRARGSTRAPKRGSKLGLPCSTWTLSRIQPGLVPSNFDGPAGTYCGATLVHYYLWRVSLLQQVSRERRHPALEKGGEEKLATPILDHGCLSPALPSIEWHGKWPSARRMDELRW